MTDIEKQIKKLKNIFANLPEDFKSFRYGTIKGIQEQLDGLGDKVGFIWYVESVNGDNVTMGKFIANLK